MPKEDSTPKKGRGGKREGAGAKRNADKIPSDPDLARIKLETEKLITKAAPLALKALIRALGSDSPEVAAKYLLDRVYGRPREADRLGSAGDKARQELELATLEKERELLEERILLARLARQEKERKEGDAPQGKEEGRFYPAGGAGVGVCGRYHAALDRALYPSTPLLAGEYLAAYSAGAPCSLCGELAPQVEAEDSSALEEELAALEGEEGEGEGSS